MLNPKNSYKAYSKTDVNTSDQLTLIIMLYDGLLRFLKKAMVKIEENDVAQPEIESVAQEQTFVEYNSTGCADGVARGG